MRDTPARTVHRKHGMALGSAGGFGIPGGIFLGVVVDNRDPDKLGRLKVLVSRFYGVPGDSESDGEGAIWCRQAIGTGGTAPGPGGGTYGVIGQPPSVGNEVLVAFTADRHSGIVIGVLPDPAKWDDSAGARESAEPESTRSPHPQEERIERQGLARDGLRGRNTSRPRRDPHSRVFGITSPDGHAITLDDGRDGSLEGRNIRIRSSSGNQIYMDDDNGFIYVCNRDGTTWIEMDADGSLDVYSRDSINFATDGDFNVHCAGKFNVQANEGVNMAAGGAGAKIAATSGRMEMYGQDGMNQETEGTFNVKGAGKYTLQASLIDLQGAARPADRLNKPNELPGNSGVRESIATKVPEREPWGGHSNPAPRPAPPPNSFAAQGGTGSGAESRRGNIGDSARENVLPEARPDEFLEWAAGVDRRVEPELIEIMRRVADRFGRRLTITSGYRDPGRNKAAGGAGRSQHMLARAVDVSGAGLSNVDRTKLIEIASSEGITGIGVYDNSLHFDIRDSGRSAWGSDFTAGTIPGYAESALTRHKSTGFA